MQSKNPLRRAWLLRVRLRCAGEGTCAAELLTFSRDDDKARADAFDARWALTLQARVRWLNAALRLNTVQAYVRMGIARRAWADLPVQRRAAARLLRACMRRRLLSEQLERFRAATYGLPLESVVNLRGIPRAQRAAIRKVLEPPAEGGEEEHTDLFAKFLQRQASHASGGSGAGARSRPATATATVPDQVRTLASRDAGSSERIVGVDVEPVEGMRVVLRNAALVEFPELLEDSGGGPGTITWVDPEDADGDGVTRATSARWCGTRRGARATTARGSRASTGWRSWTGRG